MVSNLQFAAVAAYLLWCLFSALTGAIGSDGQAVAPDIDETDEEGIKTGSRCSRGTTHSGP